MNVPVQINDSGHEDVRAWLAHALHGQEPLPRLTPDESHHLGILRLEKSLKPAVRDSIRDACRQLVRQFCADGKGQVAYLEELLSLASAFKDPETVEDLSGLALRFPQLPRLPTEVRLAVLATLVDVPPPRSPAFWAEILKQNREQHAALALSGVLATNPASAISMLPALPNAERVGQAAALKLDLAWDTLSPKQRFQFVQDIKAILPQCGTNFAAPVTAWAAAKQSTFVLDSNPRLRNALFSYIGQDSNPRTLTPKLCPCVAA